MLWAYKHSINALQAVLASEVWSHLAAARTSPSDINDKVGGATRPESTRLEEYPPVRV